MPKYNLYKCSPSARTRNTRLFVYNNEISWFWSLCLLQSFSLCAAVQPQTNMSIYLFYSNANVCFIPLNEECSKQAHTQQQSKTFIICSFIWMLSSLNQHICLIKLLSTSVHARFVHWMCVRSLIYAFAIHLSVSICLNRRFERVERIVQYPPFVANLNSFETQTIFLSNIRKPLSALILYSVLLCFILLRLNAYRFGFIVIGPELWRQPITQLRW